MQKVCQDRLLHAKNALWTYALSLLFGTDFWEDSSLASTEAAICRGDVTPLPFQENDAHHLL